MKKLILTLTVLSGLAIGAPAAPPMMIPSLPFEIDLPGHYILDPSAVAQPYGNPYSPAIRIMASNVDLDLNELQIDSVWNSGVVVGDGNPANAFDHISITNGTVNATAPNPNQGLNVSGSFVSVQNVTVTGPFAAGATDYGSNDSWKNCIFQEPLLVMPANPNTGLNSYQNVTVTKYPVNGPFPGRFMYTAEDALESAGSAKGSNFKNVTVLEGNVTLSPLDTYKNFFGKQPPTITGGTASK
jgi:hypothetical protein